MPPSPGSRRNPFSRLLVVALGASFLALAASGCEYFTSERLARLKPGGDPNTAATLPAETGSPSATGDESIHLTTAEVVAMLERIVRGNEHELDDLLARVEKREEQEEAHDVFQHLDDLKRSLDRARKKALEAGETSRIEEIDRQEKTLAKPWTLARERLDLDLRARTLMLERIEILRSVLAHDRWRLDSALETGDFNRLLDEKPPGPVVDQPAEPKKAEEAAKPVETAEPKKAEEAAKPVEIPIIPGAPVVAKEKEKEKEAEAEKKDGAPGTEAAEPKKPAAPPSKELVSARKSLEVRSSTVQKLQERSISLDARKQSLARSLELIRELVENSRKSARNANETRDFLQDELADDKPSAAAQAWTHDGGDALGSMDRRVRAAEEDEKRLRTRFEEMAEEREMVEDALRKIGLRAQLEREGLEKTLETVEALESPLSSYNLWNWFRDHGPPIAGTLIVMSLLYLLVSRYAHRLVELFAARGLRGSKAERDNRMETLVSVLQNTGSVLVLAGGASTLLSQVGIPVAPLLGGAAVAGVAVAFGAQNLIKDFFYGFMILLENQYKLKDVVKIGDHSGQVEQITLRMTALRDSDGGLHFLPNGSTTSVVNLTHGWSSSSFNVRIAWEEDVDRVMAIIIELGKELRQDPKFRLMIVDELNMMGVDALTDNAVVILFSIKTLPLQQWNVKREFLKRLKKKFQEKNVLVP